MSGSLPTPARRLPRTCRIYKQVEDIMVLVPSKTVTLPPDAVSLATLPYSVRRGRTYCRFARSTFFFAGCTMLLVIYLSLNPVRIKIARRTNTVKKVSGWFINVFLCWEVTAYQA